MARIVAGVEAAAGELRQPSGVRVRVAVATAARARRSMSLPLRRSARSMMQSARASTHSTAARSGTVRERCAPAQCGDAHCGHSCST